MAGSDTAVISPSLELIFEDGEPMDTPWHQAEMNLLIDVIRQTMIERGRSDFFVGGNMFVYYSLAQARAVVTESLEKKRHFRGPDVFWVDGAEARGDRKGWVVWEENGRYPDLIIELLSPSTARIDRTIKKELYERTFRTPDYFMYDPDSNDVEGFRLVERAYRPIAPDERGRWRVASLDLWLGTWHGLWAGVEMTWLRFYDAAGRLIPTAEEAERQRADTQKARADTEKARADTADAEVVRLREIVAKLRCE